MIALAWDLGTPPKTETCSICNNATALYLYDCPTCGDSLCAACLIELAQDTEWTPHRPHSASATGCCISCAVDADANGCGDHEAEVDHDCPDCHDAREIALELREVAIDAAAAEGLPWPFGW